MWWDGAVTVVFAALIGAVFYLIVVAERKDGKK
jgi:hypothetical protein